MYFELPSHTQIHDASAHASTGEKDSEIERERENE